MSKNLLELVTKAYWEIRGERGKVYGNPKENHRGIAQIWAPILKEHWNAIRSGDPIPEWVVAMLMSGLKYDRKRIRFHEDNFIDEFIYDSFVYDWQKEWQEKQTLKGNQPLRIYVAGPFSAPTQEGRDANCRTASNVGLQLMKLGHMAHVPHSATAPWHNQLEYEDFMRLDFDIIERWADALYYIAPSPGTDRELKLAESLNLRIFRNLIEVPNLRYQVEYGRPIPLKGPVVSFASMDDCFKPENCKGAK